MSYSICIRGGGMCTGCMECQEPDHEEEIFVCADCGEEIDPDDVYEVDGDKLCRDCLCDRYRISA